MTTAEITKRIIDTFNYNTMVIDIDESIQAACDIIDTLNTKNHKLIVDNIVVYLMDQYSDTDDPHEHSYITDTVQMLFEYIKEN